MSNTEVHRSAWQIWGRKSSLQQLPGWWDNSVWTHHGTSEITLDKLLIPIKKNLSQSSLDIIAADDSGAENDSGYEGKEKRIDIHFICEYCWK